MNCRQCKHWAQEGAIVWVGLNWPCARGVASLETYWSERPESMTKMVVHKLPWLIEEHGCPEFEEAK